MNLLISLLLVAAFFNALSWIILIPIWQYPDEQAHFAQVQYIAEIGGIPEDNRSFDTSYEVSISEKILGTERDEAGNNKFTYHPEYKLNFSDSLYGPGEIEIASLPKSARSERVKNEATLNPPLYYFLSAQVYKIFTAGDLFARVYAGRLLSTLFLLLTIFLAFKTGQLIFKNNEILPITLAALVSFKPMLVFSSTGVLPDILTIFLFSLFIYLSLTIIRDRFTILRAIAIFLVIVLGAATRQNFLITLFIFPFVVLHQFVFNKKSRLTILVTITIFAISLFIASYFVPALDFIHRFDYPESSRKIADNPLANLSYFDHLRWTMRHTIAEVWPWYWGVYKWLSLTLPPIVYQIINRLIPLAVIGLVIKLFLIIKKKEVKVNSGVFFLIFTSVVYFFAITTFDYLHRKNNGYSFGIQGRYFFPVIIPQLALLVFGFSKIFEIVTKKFAKFGFFLLIVLFFVFNNFSLAYVSASYYSTSTLNTFLSHASYYKPEIFKGHIILVILVATIIFQTIFLIILYKYLIQKRRYIINQNESHK